LTTRGADNAAGYSHAPSLGAERNLEVYGKCNNPYGHGHDYVLEVSVAGEPHAETGRVLPLPDLDEFVERVILKEVRYRDLNTEVAEFATLVPTTENLAKVAGARLAAEWSAAFAGQPVRLEKVRIHETKRNIFEVRFNPTK